MLLASDKKRYLILSNFRSLEKLRDISFDFLTYKTETANKAETAA